MTQAIKIGFMLLFLTSVPGFATPVLQGSYWRCTTLDSVSKEWTSTNTYQKLALNLAFAQCKKESTVPSSCKTSAADCEGFNMGRSTRTMWRCTALDQPAQAWRSIYYAHRDDAALAAKAFCRQESSVPDTCSINMITCTTNTEE